MGCLHKSVTLAHLTLFDFLGLTKILFTVHLIFLVILNVKI